MNNYELSCFKKTDSKILGDENGFFELSMHKMDSVPGDEIVWAVSAPYSDDGGYQYRNPSEKACATKLIEILGLAIVTDKDLERIGLRDELHQFDFEKD
jgi:hypothetical protein